jgi:LysR family transcriptional activator of nhaA
LKTLERVFGEPLFEKQGRNIKLTETGEIALRYARQIFELGDEMTKLIDGHVTGRPELLRIGVADTLPKLLAYRVLEPLYSTPTPPRLDIREGSAEKLLQELSVHLVDAVILDCPIPPSVNVRAYNHLLGKCGVSFLRSSSSYKSLKHRFPKCLEEVDLLLPSTAASVRAELDRWFQHRHLSVRVTGEFQDSALLKLFGRHGRGVFPVPTLIEREVCEEMDCKVVGRITDLIEQYYLITTQRRLNSQNLARLGGSIGK